MPLIENDYETYISCTREASQDAEDQARKIMDTVIEGMDDLDHELATQILQGLKEICYSTQTVASHLRFLETQLIAKTEPDPKE
jgi:predicted ribonuclease toxin of YeeF-YezG toxin-antitoxin module